MDIKYNSDILSGGIFLALAAGVYALIPSQIQTLETTAVTAQTIPRIITVCLFLFSLCLLLQGIFRTPKKTVRVDGAFFRSLRFRREMRSLLFASFFILYGVLLTFLGYVPATAILSVGILLYYGARKWYYYAISLFAIALVYGVFAMLLDVNLP